MTDRLLADLVVLTHLAFVVFAVFGGLLALRWRPVAAVHLPAAVWATLVEACGWYCPLTGLENRLRLAAGRQGVPGGFVEQHVVPVLYPIGLTRDTQLVLAALVVLINIVVYGMLLRRRRAGGPAGGQS